MLENEYWKHLNKPIKEEPKIKKRKIKEYSSIFDYSNDDEKREISCNKQQISPIELIDYMNYINSLDIELNRSKFIGYIKDKEFPLIYYNLKQNIKFIDEYFKVGLIDILLYYIYI